MHLPDGFISPHLYIPAYIMSLPLWFISFRRFFQTYEKSFSKILLLTTFSLIAQNVMIPLPFATSAHAIGSYAIGIVFGPSTAFICETIVLIISSALKGGLTVLPINALILGLLGPYLSYLFYNFLPNFRLKPFLCAYIGVSISALAIGLVLSLQYFLDRNYFSIEPKVLLPAILIPHILFIGPAEGLYTTLILKAFERLK